MPLKVICFLVFPTLVQLSRIQQSSSGSNIERQAPTDKEQDDCVNAAYHPFYKRDGGLDWDKAPSIAKAKELCTKMNSDKDAALKYAECLVVTWSAGEAAKAGCDSTAGTDEISNYTACMANGKGWLGDEGADLCSRKEFASASAQTDCVKKAYYPFYKRDGGLDWDKTPSITKARELCTKMNSDKDAALKYAECLVVTWSAGEAAKAGCGSMAGTDVISNYTACMANGKGWLGDDGVDICSRKDFASASEQTACIKKAYYPFYKRAGGLDWDKAPSITKARELCHETSNDKDAALSYAECLVVAWSAGDAAKAGCGSMAGTDVISNYTACIATVKEWMGDEGVGLCSRKGFASASVQSDCVRKAYDPFYKSSGLDWNKAPSIKKAKELCGKTGFNATTTLKFAECVVQSVRESGNHITEATAQCERYFAIIDTQRVCVTETQKLLLNASIGPHVAESLCKKSHFDTVVSASMATCVIAALSQEIDAAGLLGFSTCMEKIWRNTSGCNEQLFGPVGDSKRAVFIVDISGSMDTTIPGHGARTRLELMKSELAAVLRNLHQDQSFTILAFNTAVKALPGGLVQADDSNITEAISWVNALAAGSQTNIEKPIRQAMGMDAVESIHILSDGMPNAGCTHVSCLSLRQDVPVHATLLYPGTEETSERAGARQLLLSISEISGGTFREPQIG